MDALEIGVLRRVARLNQGFKPGLHQSRYAAAQHALLTEQVGFGFDAERCFHNGCAIRAEARTVGKADIVRVTGVILINGNQARDSLAGFIFAANRVARPFRGNHKHINVLRRLDQLVMDVEAMGKCQRFPFGQVGGNLRFVDVSLLLIRNQHHNDVGFPGCFGDGYHLKALGLRFRLAFASLIQAYNNVYPAVTQVQGVRMPLAAIANNGNGFPFQQVDVTIFAVVNLRHFDFLLACRQKY